jgi:hypothetical protein
MSGSYCFVLCPAARAGGLSGAGCTSPTKRTAKTGIPKTRYRATQNQGNLRCERKTVGFWQNESEILNVFINNLVTYQKEKTMLFRKVSDEFTVPLCRGHHREVHRCGNEAAWWNKAGIDPTIAARGLWLETHPLPTISDKARDEDRISAVVNNSDRKSVGHDRSPPKRGRK